MEDTRIRVLALDLDGTLTNDEKKITPRTRAALDAANYRFVLSFNSTLIVLGAMGILQPAASAMLHNLSTIGISLKSMTNLIQTPSSQPRLKA